MTTKKQRIVCLCNGVTDKDILRILKKGARNLEDVKKFTSAATGCGRCRSETETIVMQFVESKSTDLQTNIDF
ncbi:MAG: (2Fe-2S)-binding protein [Prolixibacteraceae bacterium]|jgi:bacterioferritin-associated ferredoxin|nr:(2Fe-2S)-binding protein [Prolixibacteraceae bacterium]